MPDMDEIKVHRCLFCCQTFDSASDKDDHILGHFSHETCLSCNQDLIRIGGKLYALHDASTCIKISEPFVTYEPIIVKSELSDPDATELDEETISAALDFEIGDQHVKSEDVELTNALESIDLEIRSSPVHETIIPVDEKMVQNKIWLQDLNTRLNAIDNVEMMTTNTAQLTKTELTSPCVEQSFIQKENSIDFMSSSASDLIDGSVFVSNGDANIRGEDDPLMEIDLNDMLEINHNNERHVHDPSAKKLQCDVSEAFPAGVRAIQDHSYAMVEGKIPNGMQSNTPITQNEKSNVPRVQKRPRKTVTGNTQWPTCNLNGNPNPNVIPKIKSGLPRGRPRKPIVDTSPELPKKSSRPRGRPKKRRGRQRKRLG